MRQIIPSLKGTRDFYPDDKYRHNWLLARIRKISESFGYQEYEVPYLEKLELYAAKSGEELVKKQAFVFADKGGEEITLRPELTPSLARMVAQRQEELTYPLRWWAFGPIWRYERPGKGRSREFFQWNIDMIGADSPEADAELLAIAASLFKDLGLKPEQVAIRINDRRLMHRMLQRIGIPEEKIADILHLIDKKDKLSAEGWESYAVELGFSSKNLEDLCGILENKNLWRDSSELLRCFQVLEVMGLREYVLFDPMVIRGLDYYTGIVFEAFDQDGGRAILGGGHYDNLVEDVGGTSLPGVGFAMGDVMLPIVLEKYGLIPAEKQTPADVLVTVFDASCFQESLSVSKAIRGAGYRTICFPEASKLQKQLKYADKMGIPLVVILGPDEIANNAVVIKDLRNTSQKTVARNDLLAEVKAILAS